MQTFTERISDESKVSLAGSFIIWLKHMAVANDKHENELWSMWQNYSEECRLADQSAVISEFCLWNKLMEVN